MRRGARPVDRSPAAKGGPGSTSRTTRRGPQIASSCWHRQYCDGSRPSTEVGREGVVRHEQRSVVVRFDAARTGQPVADLRDDAVAVERNRSGKMQHGHERARAGVAGRIVVDRVHRAYRTVSAPSTRGAYSAMYALTLSSRYAFHSSLFCASSR